MRKRGKKGARECAKGSREMQRYGDGTGWGGLCVSCVQGSARRLSQLQNRGPPSEDILRPNPILHVATEAPLHLEQSRRRHQGLRWRDHRDDPDDPWNRTQTPALLTGPTSAFTQGSLCTITKQPALQIFQRGEGPNKDEQVAREDGWIIKKRRFSSVRLQRLLRCCACCHVGEQQYLPLKHLSPGESSQSC